MCLCLVRRSGSTIAVRRRSHSSNRRVALTMFIWMVGHNSAGVTGCQWALRPSSFLGCTTEPLSSCDCVIEQELRVSFKQPNQERAGQRYLRYSWHDHQRQHQDVTKRGVTVCPRQSQIFPALDFSLKPFVHAIKP